MERLRAAMAGARGAPGWLVDAAVAGLVATLDVIVMLADGCDCDLTRGEQAALTLGAALPLALRRRFPLAVQLAVTTASGASYALAAPTGLVALLLSTYTVGMAPAPRQRWLGLGAGVACLVASDAWVGGIDPLLVPPGVAVIVLPWVLGLLWRTRAAALERERDERARTAVGRERARLARELHDVVAHAVSVMVVQTSAARHVLPGDRARADEALARVEQTGRESLVELRRLLGLLSEGDGTDASLAPQPRLDRLDDLLARFGDAGLAIDLAVEGERRALPPGVELSAPWRTARRCSRRRSRGA